MNKALYTSIFSQIKKEHDEAGPVLARTKNSDVLIVDGTNNFIRVWSAVPTLNDNGEHCGGVSGFLTTIGYAIKLLKPTRVIVVFDGKGGSARRKKLFPDYKNKRSMTVRVNRAYEELSNPDDERKAMMNQMSLLVNDFLGCLPVSVIAVDNIEADDAIAYLTTSVFNKPENRVTIMSADKDFLQLVNERVCVWSPIKKKIYGILDVINQYTVHPTNFVYYRMLEGDDSDNIPGIKGIALKTAIKRFPMITDAKETSVEEILEYAKNRINESKVYSSVVDNSEVVVRNHSLMQLKSPDFSPSLQMQISGSVDKANSFNKFLFIQKLTQHGMHSAIPNYHIWLQEIFYPLACYTK
jgi:DNA polymerase-1